MENSEVTTQSQSAIVREDFSPLLFGDRLAFVLQNVLNVDECAAVIRAAKSVGFKQATVRTGFKTVEYQTDFRVGDNCYLTDASIRETLFQRIKPHLPAEFQFGKLIGLNERMTVLRYGPGGFFGEHTDGTYIVPDDSAISFITVQLYLNEGFEGGETTFFPDGYLRSGTGAKDRRRVPVQPRTGSAAVFEHKILHEGSLLRSGEKFTLRADVLYSRYYPPIDDAEVTGSDEAIRSESPESREAKETPALPWTEGRNSWVTSRCTVQ